MRPVALALLCTALSLGFLPSQGRAVQDGAWWTSLKAFSESSNWEDAVHVRKALFRLGESHLGMTRALTAILLHIESKEKGGKKLIRALGKYLSKVGQLPSTRDGHLAAFKVALKTRGIVGRLLALGHLDQLLAAGAPPASLSGQFKALKIAFSGSNKGATEEGLLLIRLKETTVPDALVALTARTRNEGLIYVSAVQLMQGLTTEDKSAAPKVIEQLVRVSRWRVDHVAHLIRAMESVKPCGSCGDQKRVRCTPCGGMGRRRLVCEACNGKGVIEWNPKMAKTEKRKEVDKMRGYPANKSYCPSCIGRSDARRAVKECTFCETTGSIECQRCKWYKFDLRSLVEIRSCGVCTSTGMMFTHILHPCAFCQGVGAFVLPVSDPTLVIGPEN